MLVIHKEMKRRTLQLRMLQSAHRPDNQPPRQPSLCVIRKPASLHQIRDKKGLLYMYCNRYDNALTDHLRYESCQDAHLEILYRMLEIPCSWTRNHPVGSRSRITLIRKLVVLRRNDKVVTLKRSATYDTSSHIMLALSRS
jgi:hypothetical protein